MNSFLNAVHTVIYAIVFINFETKNVEILKGHLKVIGHVVIVYSVCETCLAYVMPVTFSSYTGYFVLFSKRIIAK